MVTPSGRARGAYGLRLDGIDGAESLLIDVPDDWPALALYRAHGVATHRHDTFSEERAVIVLRNGGEVVVDRRSSEARFRVPSELEDEELIHPYLAPVAAVVGYWLGRESLHAGSFVAEGGVWALAGDRESGKSSTLAGLARAGFDVFGDDVLVASGTAAYAGPRTIDLRADAAARLGEGEHGAGGRDRWRLSPRSVAAERELRGLVFLEWSDELELKPLSAADALRRVAAARVLRIPARPDRLLELAARPAWVLRRPRAWESLAQTVEVLASLSHGAPPATHSGAE